jgi:HlyD family secretion protein
MLYTLLAALVSAVGWIAFGRLDIVAVAEGRLVPRVALPIVQPVDQGVVRDILVREGDSVAADQLLLRLDSALSDADVRALAAEIVARELQLRRIDAELLDQPLVRREGDSDDAYALAARHYAANRDAFRGNIAIESAARARLEQELRAAMVVESKLAGTLPIVRTTVERFRTLRREGFVSELYSLERERELIEREHDHRAQLHAIDGLQEGLRQAAARIAQVTATYHASLRAERAQAAERHARVVEDLAKERWRNNHIELRAPQAGIVKNLGSPTPGVVVPRGAVLLTLVPLDEELQAEVLIGNADIGFVREGQQVRVKLVGYPFQKYGLLDGRVLRVGPDAIGEGAVAAAPGSPTVQSAYRARVALASQALPFDGAWLPLAPGMQVSAEIRLGARTLLEYLVAPVSRAWHDAARER